MIEQYRPRILIVDDDPINVQLMEAQLASKYDIIEAFSGEEALDILNREKPDLIILDVMMPGINGYEVCRRIKSSEETSFIPVIIVTALSSRDDRLEGIEAGADDFLTKPIDRVELLTRSKNLLESKKLHDRLVSSEQKFRTLFENSVDAIMLFTRKGAVLEANAAACSMLGYEHEALLGMSREDLVAPEYREKCMENTASVLENGQATFEALYVKRDGSRVPVEMSVNLIDYGDIPAFLNNGRDISERKKAEEAISKYTEDLSKANQALKSMDRMKDEFVSNLSHELKTPLISIKGYSELVHDEVLGPLNDKQKNAMQIVLDKYDHLSFLLDSLIYMSIAKSGKVNYRFDPVRIEDSLKRIAEYFSFKAGEKQITISTSFEDNLPLVMGDVEYLPYLFRSLVDNAIKFSPEGGTVLITAFREDGHVHATIKDSGIGIPKTEFSNVFKRFYQVDSSMARKYGGSGLGLYVSKMITEVHSGEIWIESQEGSGTTVHIRFPVYSPSSGR